MWLEQQSSCIVVWTYYLWKHYQQYEGIIEEEYFIRNDIMSFMQPIKSMLLVDNTQYLIMIINY